MASARDQALSPRLLLLLEVHNGRHARLKGLADRLGVTVQAVSEALRRLADENLVNNEDGVWKPTPQGTEWLHRNFQSLQRFIEQAMGDLRIIDQCVAMAAEDFSAGDPVGLFMSGGHLWARRGAKDKSRGVARSGARRGELVNVEDLRGVVDLVPGTIRVLAHATFPDARELAALRRMTKAIDGSLVAVHDTASRAAAERLGWRRDLEFAPVEGAIDAARRGLDVLYLAPREEAPGALARLAAAKDAAGDPIKVRSVGG